MGRVIFMCGPAGSEKSTVARRYEQQGMTRLSFDQEAWSRSTREEYRELLRPFGVSPETIYLATDRATGHMHCRTSKTPLRAPMLSSAPSAGRVQIRSFSPG